MKRELVETMWLVCVLGAVSASLSAPIARACSEPPATCTAPVRLFPVRVVPGNLIYFKVLVEDPGELTLRDGETLIESDVRMIGSDRVFAPLETVEGGRELTLEYTTVCPEPSPWQPELTPSRKTFTFETEGTREVADVLTPRLEIAESGYRRPDSDFPEKFVRIEYVHTRSPTQHLHDRFARVDGRGYPFGSRDHSTWWNESHLELRTRCAEPQEDLVDSCGTVEAFKAGEHQIEVWHTIVGAEQQPSHASLTLDLTCEDASPDGDAEADAESEEAADARARRALERDSDGCALATSSSGAEAAFAFAALLVLRARRRRTR